MATPVPGRLYDPVMAAPTHVPKAPNRPKAYTSPPRREGSWTADRPGEVLGGRQPEGGGLGHQGPDQGYVLKLAERFRDDLVLAPGEHAADALTGCRGVALRRASLFGRAPVADDLRLALTVFGYLDQAPDDLVAWRRTYFDEVHHEAVHYVAAREIADLVPESTLHLSAGAALSAHRSDWRAPLGL